MGATAAIMVEQTENPKRAAILAAASTLFLDSGFGATSMDAIAAEAGVSKRTVYAHFESKEALFGAIMVAHCHSAGDLGHPIGVLDLPPDEMLLAVGQHFLAFLVSDPVVALYRVVLGEAGRFPELGEVFYRNGPERMVARVAEYLGGLRRADGTTIEDPVTATWQFLSLVKDPLHMQCCIGVAGAVPPERIAASVRTGVGAFRALHRL